MRQSIVEAAAKIMAGEILTEETFFTFDDHLKPKGKMGEMLNAQVVGKPLTNRDGSLVKNTLYLGEGTYLAKKPNGKYAIFTFGRTREGDDGSVSWESYTAYDHGIQISPVIIKKAAQLISKV